MMKDMYLEYWKEAVSECMDELQPESELSENDIEFIADAMMISSEQIGMAFGHDGITNPLKLEIEELKKKHEKEIKEYESQTLIYRTYVARGARVNENDVHIDHGHIYID